MPAAARTYLNIPHVCVGAKTGIDTLVAWALRTRTIGFLQLRAVLAPTRRDGPIWAQFVAVVRLVYIKYTAAIAV